MKWFDEVRLCSRPLAEIGLAFFVREICKNECHVNKWDLRDTFGPQCETLMQNLVCARILEIEDIGNRLLLTIRAPGDKKRERCRKLGRKRREGNKARKKEQ